MDVHRHVSRQYLRVRARIEARNRSFSELRFCRDVARSTPVVRIIITILVLLAAEILAINRAAREAYRNLTVFFMGQGSEERLRNVLRQVTVCLENVDRYRVLACNCSLVWVPENIRAD